MTQHKLVTKDREIMSGTPVFTGTRVPARTLFDYLEHSHPLDEFLDDFPTVSREHAVALLESLKQKLLDETYESAA